MTDKPRYRVNETSYIDGKIHEDGAEVEYDHDPGANLDPVNDAAKARVKAVEDAGNKRIGPKHPEFIPNMIARNLDEGDAKGPRNVKMPTKTRDID